MARDQETIENIPLSNWLELTNDNVTEITFQVINGKVMLRGTVGASAPLPTVNTGFVYEEGEGHLNVAMNTLFKGAGINRVWARSLEFQSAVIVDHA